MTWQVDGFLADDSVKLNLSPLNTYMIDCVKLLCWECIEIKLIP